MTNASMCLRLSFNIDLVAKEKQFFSKNNV